MLESLGLKLFLCLLTLLLSKCCFVFLLCCASFAFNALDPKIILHVFFKGCMIMAQISMQEKLATVKHLTTVDDFCFRFRF